MRATDFLKEQHDHVAALMERARETLDDELRVRLIGHLAEELTVHSALEERFFYPLLVQAGLEGDAVQSLEDHEVVRGLIEKLLALPLHDPAVRDTIERLDDAVREHVSAEEEGLFPLIYSRIAPEELERVGADMVGTVEAMRALELLKLDGPGEPPEP